MKNKVVKQIYNYVAVILGTFLLAFGSVIFLTECELVAGGLSGIAIIIQHFVNFEIYDYLIAALTAIFWIFGLIFVGKDFALKTLLSSLLYIGFTFLLKRVVFFENLALEFAGKSGGNSPVVGNYILCGLFGGVFVGSGVALTFLGGGSTGGVDVLQAIGKKYLNIKESISSLIIDGLIILAGVLAMCITDITKFIPALCGILSSVVTAAVIEIVYIRNQTSYQVDIISNKWQEISDYAQNVLERGATIIRAEGGYKGEERVILRVVFDKLQYEKIREYIAQIDPNAFVTFTQTNAVYGEGFSKNRKIVKNKKK